MSNEWGTPDWQVAAAYGDVKSWNLNRWRWEFTRRRDDVRAAFQESAEASFQYRQPFVGKPGFPMAHLRPDEPGFTAMHPLAKSLGLPQIPNPRIGAQPFQSIGFSDWDEVVQWFNSDKPPEGFERIDFDLSKPLEPQLRAASMLLKDLQEMRIGKVVQRRRHPAKWLAYLRTLDAREAMPDASWREFTDALFHAGLLERHKNPAGGYCAPPPQAGRDKWEAANALRNNF
ncbi:hypothetical protein [Roseovarius sp. MBR-6]|jgi:hypothetical protein|uniref:hypothetical protein n=1 Tax=Roseovarius sp. MBR-6 TaxID=3156459 RepID=UPI0033935C0B